MSGVRGAGSRLAALLTLGCAVGALSACSPLAQAQPGTSVGPGAALPPRSIVVQGRTVPYQRVQPVASASIAARSSRLLTVFVTGSPDSGGGQCGPPAIRILTQETPSTVRILVADYEAPAAPDTACPAIGYAAAPQPVHLMTPLAGRQLLDAATGRALAVLDGSTVPTLPSPPAPFPFSELEQAPHSPIVVRSWTDPHGNGYRQMQLLTAPLAALTGDMSPYGRIVRQFDVHGNTATLYADDSPDGTTYEAQWSPNSQQTIRLELDASPARHWTAAQAVDLARAVTGYRSAGGPGALPPPVTPGTSAATYSSEGGPVQHAPNLLKSSGVWVGLSCQGAGQVTVALRGVTHTWTCTDRLSTHITKSTGRPDETFYLDVHATGGVRWTLTLNRASLDGS